MARWLAVVIALVALAAPSALAETPFITLASTTSTENSGLFAHLLPKFRAARGIDVRVVALGTGQAIRIARNGDADALLVHHRPSEEKFVAEGFGLERRDVMYNDFVIVGPKSDPAGVADGSDAIESLARIAEAEATFLSRGDDSGTHKKERELWAAARIDIDAASGRWYRETGSGMGATLNTAAALSGYALTDRGTWLGFRNKADLAILFEGDPRLFNPYGVIMVNPARHPHVKEAEARAFIDWLTGPEGQAAIADFRLQGRQAFWPNAGS